MSEALAFPKPESKSKPPPFIDVDYRPELVFEITGRVVRGEDGKARLVPDSISRWRAVLGRMAGRPVVVTISREKERRSIESNKYLWGTVYQRIVDEFRAIAQDAGERPVFATKDEVHEWLKLRFLGVEETTIGGVKIERPASTTKLTPTQFSAYIEEIKKLVASRWQIYIED